jgi:PAS domain S-box-containing protein
LKESEQRYRQLFEGDQDAMIVYDAHGKCMDCNRAALRMYGYSREELLALTVADLVRADYHETLEGQVKTVLAGETLISESVRRCKDGTVIHVEVNACRLEYQGQPAILAVMRDTGRMR